MTATKQQIERALAELRTKPAIRYRIIGPSGEIGELGGLHKSHLQLPILGNPNGRIFQAIQLGESIPAMLLAILQRYGDLLPKTAIAEYYDAYGKCYTLLYTQVSSGNWSIADMEEAMPIVPGIPPGVNDPTL